MSMKEYLKHKKEQLEMYLDKRELARERQNDVELYRLENRVAGSVSRILEGVVAR